MQDRPGAAERMSLPLGAAAPSARDDDTETGGSLAPAVSRAAAILDLLAADPTTPSGPSELSRKLGLPKSSIANICSALADAGLVRRVGSGFALGRKVAELGGAYLASIDQVQEFYTVCDELAAASQETMQLAVLDGLEVVYIARHDGRQTIRLASEIGRRLPASCTAIGKAALATLDPDELSTRLQPLGTLPRLTSNSHRTVAELLADLDETRDRGYAIDNEETTEGIVCFGVAVPRRYGGSATYGASVTILKARATESRREALVVDLFRLQDLLSNPLQTRAAGEAFRLGSAAAATFDGASSPASAAGTGPARDPATASSAATPTPAATPAP